MVAILRKIVLVVASFSVLQSPPTASARGLAGLGPAISARFGKGPPTAHTPPEDAAQSLKLAEAERVRAVSAQCCADLNEADGVGEWASGEKKQKWPKNCLVDGAKCPTYGFHGLASEPEFPAGATMCIDVNGNIITSITADTPNPKKSTTTSIDYYGYPLPPCDPTAIERLRFEAWFWVGGIALCAVIQHVATLYTARLPLEHGDEGALEVEDMTYEERLLAVTTLSLVCGGLTLMFVLYEIYLLRCICILMWTWWVLIPFLLFMVSTAIAVRRLEHRMPNKRTLGHLLFGLWRRFFGFELVFDNYDLLLEESAVEDRQFMIAQMPHAVVPFGAILGNSVSETALPGMWPMSGVVATALMWTPVVRDMINVLGAREAGTASIMRMFADGFKAVAVITGGIAEMFVSRNTECLTCLRRGFAKIALQGGHTIIPVFVFGVSRAHVLFPFADNRVTRFLSRKCKIPLVAFHGAFGLIPYRQKMKMVVGSPIIVEKASSDVTDDQAQALCDQVQAVTLKLYEDHKPAWEPRPIRFES